MGIMAQLLFSLILLLCCQMQPWPQTNPFVETSRDQWQAAYRHFKPGARVSSELKALDDQELELRGSFANQRINHQEFTLESQRIQVHRHLLKCLALVGAPRDEPIELIVVRITRAELRRVFPLGRSFAEPLVLNNVYSTEPGSRRRVKYLALYQWEKDGPRFAVFSREPDLP
jgi:hypothetical protein